ncbi:hypothetical protein V1525DRAFT_410283 [Lipomyces kononenkoae]|uniref:Uncharacterized protein n=1 Tax=Lipomyces kononenkoae TaxID=34357 RepID=A0ACC3SUN7_LIPKO
MRLVCANSFLITNVSPSRHRDRAICHLQLNLVYGVTMKQILSSGQPIEMTGSNNKSPVLVTTVVLVTSFTCAVLLALGMMIAMILIGSPDADDYAAPDKVSWRRSFGVGGAVIFDGFAYGATKVFRHASTMTIQEKSARIGIFLIGAMCAAISAGLVAETGAQVLAMVKRRSGTAERAIEV